MSTGLRRVLLSMAALAALTLSVWLELSEEKAPLAAQTSPLVTAAPTHSRGLVTEIASPRGGNAVAGFITVEGTALTDLFQRYDLHISTAGDENWQWLTSSYAIVRDGNLFLFDTRSLRDGFYDLRLRAVRDDGNYVEAFSRRVEIRNADPPTPTPLFNPSGTAVPFSPLSAPTPTPTPTPRLESRVPGGQGFYSPENRDYLQGVVTIGGTVNGDPPEKRFARYELAISPSGDEQWSFLHAGEEQLWQTEIYRLDTRAYEDGYYDLRLRIVYENGNYDEYYLRYLRIANDLPASALPRKLPTPAPTPTLVSPGILSPVSGQRVSGIVDVLGRTVDPLFARWELAWSSSGQEAWQTLTSSDRSVENGLLARLDLSQLPAGAYDLRLLLVRADGSTIPVVVRGLQVTPLER